MAKKTIKLTESKLRKIIQIGLNELYNSPNKEVYWNGKYQLSQIKRYLDSAPDLRVDRYKEADLEYVYDEWEKVGFSKDSEEHAILHSIIERFMEYLEYSVFYTLKRVSEMNDTKVLDPKWAISIKKGGKEEFQCFYTLILKIYQNRAIWNDFFFNPEYKEMADTYKQNAQMVRQNLNHYREILPLKEFNELNMFYMGYNPQTKKLEGEGFNKREDRFHDKDYFKSKDIDTSFDDDEWS